MLGEILNAVLFKRDDVDTIKNNSLVCRRLRVPARRLLFSGATENVVGEEVLVHPIPDDLRLIARSLFVQLDLPGGELVSGVPTGGIETLTGMTGFVLTVVYYISLERRLLRSELGAYLRPSRRDHRSACIRSIQ